MTVKLLHVITFCFLSLICTSQDPSPLKIDYSVKNQVIVSVCKNIEKFYVFPVKSELLSQSLLKGKGISRYENITNPNDFAFTLTNEIKSSINDDHLRIIYDPKLEQDILKFGLSKKEAERINAKDLVLEEKQNFYFKKIEILAGNIGYLEFNRFTAPNSSSRKTIRSAMQFLSHTDALIIDLRNNFGGKSNEMADYFFSEKTYAGRSFNKIENKWNDQYIKNKKCITDGIVMNMPVYILTSSRTFSAAEGFAYILQTLRNAKVVGDTTRGGAHLTRSFSVGNGFVAFIPYMRGENSRTNTDWEGTGVIPDIYSEEDRSLLVAQKAALSDKLLSTVDETEKRKIAWIINYLKAQEPLKTDISDFENGIGQFAEFEIIIKDNKLGFRDTHQQPLEYKPMIPITRSLFQVGKDYQVEFIKDEMGEINSIRMLWDDGWTEIIKRTK